MIISIQNGYVVEAIRHNEDQTKEDHFINTCEWSQKQVDTLEDFDFYMLEIKVTTKDLKEASSYLGAMCAKDWKEDTKKGAGGYLPQMIEECLEELKIKEAV